MEMRTTRALMRMLTGDPVEAMESAKHMIHACREPVILRDIVEDQRYKKWSRIAAAYALGLLGDKASTRVLVRAVEDRREQSSLRAHAAEALGNIKDPRAVKALNRVLTGEGTSSVKRWCVYALSEIDTPPARRALTEFRETRPTGQVAKELKSALLGFGARPRSRTPRDK